MLGRVSAKLSKSVLSSKAVATVAKAAMSSATVPAMLTKPLESVDPEIFSIVKNEGQRQKTSLCLIPSENFTSQAVLDALGSVMQNKYSEGYVGARYYGGNEFIDQAEALCQSRALAAFGLDAAQWGVNVQPLSGSPANFEVYTALLPVHGRIMSLDLPHGGHLSHGYSIPSKHISAVSKYFEVLPYRLNETTGLIDYDALEANAKLFRPKLIVMGASAYSRHIDYARIRKIADQHNAYVMMDMAHISGLIAGGVMPSPFPFADIVTTTTHKSLRGPRGAMIFFRRGTRSVGKDGVAVPWTLEADINAAVFPGHQGGPHNHTITALAVALKQAASPEFKAYAQQVMRNCATLADSLTKRGYTLVSGGTDNHLLLADVRPQGLNGAKVERILELANVAINKNTVPGDVSALTPGGIRMGSPAMTSRGLVEKDFETVAELVHRGVQIAAKVDKDAGAKTMKAFRDTLAGKDYPEIAALKKDVVDFASSFPTVPNF